MDQSVLLLPEAPGTKQSQVYDLITTQRLPGTVQPPSEAPKGGPTPADLEAARQRILKIELDPGTPDEP